MQIIMIKQEQDDCLKKGRTVVKEGTKVVGTAKNKADGTVTFNIEYIEGKSKYSRTLGCLVAFKI